MTRKERRQVCRSSHRPDAGASAAMGDGECLVKIEMTDIGSELGRTGKPHQRIEVGAVDVNLTPMGVDGLRQSLDSFLEDTMCRGIRHHHRRQLFGMLCDLGIEIIEIDVATVVGSDNNDTHTGHHG